MNMLHTSNTSPEPTDDICAISYICSLDSTLISAGHDISIKHIFFIGIVKQHNVAVITSMVSGGMQLPQNIYF